MNVGRSGDDYHVTIWDNVRGVARHNGKLPNKAALGRPRGRRRSDGQGIRPLLRLTGENVYAKALRRYIASRTVGAVASSAYSNGQSHCCEKQKQKQQARFGGSGRVEQLEVRFNTGI